VLQQEVEEQLPLHEVSRTLGRIVVMLSSLAQFLLGFGAAVL